jgi:hypothetical protein
MSLKEIIKVANYYQVKYSQPKEYKTLTPFKLLLDEFGLDVFFDFGNDHDIHLMRQCQESLPFNSLNYKGSIKSKVQSWLGQCKDKGHLSEDDYFGLTEKLNSLKHFSEKEF